MTERESIRYNALSGCDQMLGDPIANIEHRTSKEAYVEGLFSSIAPRYDLINTVISLARHKAWRRFAVSRSGLAAGGWALDVCCGTGDFAFELARAVGQTGRVVGTDFSLPMLDLARSKGNRLGLGQVEFEEANVCALPYDDDTFDCVTVGFGLRNVDDLDRAITEMVRVTKPGGRVICLEIGRINFPILTLVWRAYFEVLAPLAARLFRGRREAYEYLPKSVGEFLSPAELSQEFAVHGLVNVACHDLTLGAVCVHVGTKP